VSRTPDGRRCHDCGSSSRETLFPGTHKPYRKVDRCTDCLAEFERLAERLAEASGSDQRPAAASASLALMQTRASYRAAYRHRAEQAQGDLVDRLVPPP
jgi:hypothetical protein